MANPHRGELVVQMGEKEYKTRLNFDLMAKIESRTGQSVLSIANSLSQGQTPLTHLSIVLHAAIKGGGNDVSEKDIDSMIWDAGVVDAMRVTGEILANSLMGGQETGKEAATGE